MTLLDETCTIPHFDTAEDGIRSRRASYFENRKKASSAIDGKRAFDIAFASVALVFFLPLMAIIYLLLAVSCGNALFFSFAGRQGWGPILLLQVQIDGQEFKSGFN